MKKILIKTLTVSVLIGVNISCRERDKVEAGSASISDVLTSEVQVFSANVSASIIKSGSDPISEHGFAFSKTSENPEADNLSIKKGAIDPTTPTPIAFSGSLSGLEAKTEYFVRAFATTSSGTAYSKTAKFTTADIVQPSIQTVGSEQVSHNSAKLNGSITEKGTHPISEYGIVWGESANPGTDLATKISVRENVTNFPSQISANAQNLNPNTTYNFRAYLIANGVTSYGANMTFKTTELVQPGIRTDDGPKVGENVATAWGTLISKGSNPISEYGICWGTSANPTTANTKKQYNSDVTNFPTQFEAYMENLSPATTYHYRAYVIMSGVTTYGDNKSFTTSVSEPRVTTGDVFSITGRGTVMTGTVNSQGSYPITEIGIVYGSTNNPTTANTKLSKSGAGVAFPHNFEFVANTLGGTSGVYFRAYVISNGKTYYGESKVAYAAPPGLSAGTNSLSGSTYTLRGSITSAGTYAIREYGIVWSSTSNTPTTSHNKLAITAAPSTFPVNFTRTLAYATIGSCRGVTYRTYAITTNGTTHYSSNVGTFGTAGCIN